MVDVSYILAAKLYIQMAAVGVYVGCVKFTAIMIEGAFSHHCTDCPFQIHSLSPAQAGTVLLLLPRVNQKRLCALRGYLLEKTTFIFMKAR